MLNSLAYSTQKTNANFQPDIGTLSHFADIQQDESSEDKIEDKAGRATNKMKIIKIAGSSLGDKKSHCVFNCFKLLSLMCNSFSWNHISHGCYKNIMLCSS